MSDGNAVEVMAGPKHPIVVKSATSEAGRATLAREAERLHRARHPGVVELLLADEDHLELAWAGTHTLDTCHPSLLDAAGILAAVASTVADLHGLGIIHGRLDPSHVVLGGDGRPRLCGLRGPRPSDGDPSPAEDVAAIGRLIDHLVGVDAEPEPIPERRWGKRNWSGYHRRSLQTLADHATDEDPARRPTARAIAAAIVEAVPEARLVTAAPVELAPADVKTDPDSDEVPGPEEAVAPTQPREEEAADESYGYETDLEPEAELGLLSQAERDPHDEPRFLGLRIEPVGVEPEPTEVAATRRPVEATPLPPRAGRPLPRFTRSSAGLTTAAVVVVALSFAVVALVGWGHPGRSSNAQVADTMSSSPAPIPTKNLSDCPTTTSIPPATSAALTADVDGDGCLDSVTVDGTSVTATGVTYRVGSPGDHISVGDWDCDGVATPGIVRPSTGEVFLFDGWAASGEPITSAAAADLAGATELIAPAKGTACHGPSVRVGGGHVVSIAARPGKSAGEAGQ